MFSITYDAVTGKIKFQGEGTEHVPIEPFILIDEKIPQDEISQWKVSLSTFTLVRV